MSGLSEAILLKIRESERDGLEKHRKIAEYEKLVKELHFLDNCEKEKISSLETKIEEAETDLIARKVELSVLEIRIKSVNEVIEEKREDAVSCQQARLQKLKEMTELMDGVAETTANYVSRYSIIADPEVVEARRKVREEMIEQERQEREVLLNELSEFEDALAKRNSLETQIEEAKKALSETSKLKDQLDIEASGLMQELARLQTKRKTESDLAKEVKLLQQKVSVLMQVNGKCSPDCLLNDIALLQEGRISRGAVAGMEDAFDFSLRETDPQDSDDGFRPPQSKNSNDVRSSNAANSPNSVQKYFSKFKFRKT